MRRLNDLDGNCVSSSGRSRLLFQKMTTPKCILLPLMLMQLLSAHAYAQQLYRKQLFTLHKWTDLSLSFDLESARQLYSNSNSNNHFLPVDVDIEYGDEGRHRTFLTIPRLSVNTPYTLATVVATDNGIVENPRLEAYPSQEWHVLQSNCTGITSAIRTYIDECWRLWVVDSGQVNSLQICEPQVLAFDLVKDTLVQRFTLPGHIYTPSVSIFTALVVDLPLSDVHGKCLGGKVYIADAWGYGLIVYDALTGKSWRIEDDSMLPAEGMRRFGSAYAGIFTVSLSPRQATDRHLYFHTLNSFNEIAIPLTLVNNASFWQSEAITSRVDKFRILGTRGTQCESEVMDSMGNLYCSLISLGALISWQENDNYTADDIRAVAYNPDQLKFVTGLKINRNSKDEDELWALSSEPKLFVGGALQANEVKFQIIGCRTSDLLGNIPCTVGAMQDAKQP